MKRIVLFFILTALLLCLMPAASAANSISLSPNFSQAYAMNLFLSSFTETGIEQVDRFLHGDARVDFTHDHI